MIDSCTVANKEPESIRSFLVKWSINNNISQTSLDALLSDLHQNRGHKDLPKTARALLMTPKKAIQVNNCDIAGDYVYCHIGINLIAYCFALEKCDAIFPYSIVLDFNIDGVKFSNSTTRSLWLIQMAIENNPELDPFVIGTYFSETKPKQDFLMEFVRELKDLSTNGFHYKNRMIRVLIGSFVNDTPANSFVRNTKGHSGYSSCMKCTARGLSLDHCLVFPMTTAPKRTDADFRMRMDPAHHNGTSILESIEEIDMVAGFAIDEMHIVHLGVMKKLIQNWVGSLTKSELNEIENRAKSTEKHRPCEIHRTIRSIREFKQFKANEFRTFLMITGPVLLRDILDVEKYNHFILLHIAMRRLTEKNCKPTELETIQSTLDKFVKQFRSLYGLNKITYVVHQLTHLCDDFERNGYLKSAYKYENNCGKIVRSVRHGRNVAQQINNRALEKLKILSLSKQKPIPIELKKKSEADGKTIFKKIVLKGLQLDTSERNQWFMTKDKQICSFEYATLIDRNPKIVCKKIDADLKSFFDVPMSSVELDIFWINDLNRTTFLVIDSDFIETKMFAIPSSEGNVFVKLINYT